jgi:hypothetical protein
LESRKRWEDKNKIHLRDTRTLRAEINWLRVVSIEELVYGMVWYVTGRAIHWWDEFFKLFLPFRFSGQYFECISHLFHELLVPPTSFSLLLSP